MATYALSLSGSSQCIHMNNFLPFHKRDFSLCPWNYRFVMCYTRRKKRRSQCVSAHLQFQGKNLCTNTSENCDSSFHDGSGNSSIHRLKLFYIAQKPFYACVCMIWWYKKRGRMAISNWKWSSKYDTPSCIVYGIFIKRPFNVILNIFVPDFKHIAHRCVLLFMLKLMLLPLLVHCCAHCLFSGFQVPPHYLPTLL